MTMQINETVKRDGKPYLVISISSIGRTDAYGRFTKEGAEVVLAPVSPTRGYVTTGPQRFEFYPEGK